eukprot:scaffold49782_cov24-Tisochrysis_lutea.AAC.3
MAQDIVKEIQSLVGDAPAESEAGGEREGYGAPEGTLVLRAAPDEEHYCLEVVIGKGGACDLTEHCACAAATACGGREAEHASSEGCGGGGKAGRRRRAGPSTRHAARREGGREKERGGSRRRRRQSGGEHT